LKAEKALEVLLEKLDVLRGLFHGFDYSKFEGTPAEVLALLPAAANHIMGDATLKKLASELTEKLRNSTTVDWQFRESVRAKMRIWIRQLLRKYKYPPAGCEEAIGLVLKQAEADDWTAES
jgi:type I restriction enzyme R subunit